MLLGARQFFERRGAPTPPLPYDAEVEYLESTGTQYIDTGCGVQDGDMTLRFALGVTSGDIKFAGYYIYGIWQGTPVSGLIGGSMLGVYNGYFRLGRVQSINISADTNVHTLVSTSSSSVYFDGALTSAIASPAKKNGVYYGSFYLGRYQYNGELNSGEKLRIYGFSCGSKCDLIPVRFTNEQGVSEGAMYDRVSGQLFRNQGTGNFIVGRDTNPISARSYVNDGLIAMWDGIENAGWGVHDANATTWKNLAGNNYDINCGNTGYFSGDSFVFTGAAGTIQDWEIGDESIGNLSVCGLSELNSFFAFTASRYCGRMFAILPTNNRGFQFQTWRSTMFQNWYSDPWSVAANYDTILSDTFYNGELKPHTAGTSSWTSPSYGASIGFYGGNTYPYRGRIYNLRLYSRALTAAEIAHNYAVDKERFNLP